jgi:hypothetical protein
MLTILLRYLRSHHVGLVALFIAFGGTAYAASLPRDSVGTEQLKHGAVTSAKVRNGTLRAADFAPGTLSREPRDPAAAVRQPALQSQTIADDDIAVVGAGGDGAFTEEDYDTAGMHDPAMHPERLTAPRAGVYLVSGSADFGTDPDGSRLLGIAVNGGAACCGRLIVPASAHIATRLSTSAIVPLNAGDFVTLQAAVIAAGDSVDLSQATFAIHWLGPSS